MENQTTQLIYQRIANVMKKVGVIGKINTNLQQGFKYRGIDDVMNELHDIFAENSIFIIPNVLEISRTERVNTKGTTLFYVVAKINYKLITDDGSFVECIVTGEGMDSGDKATTKAMSIALKYALMQMLLIPTADVKDPDAESHELKSQKLEVKKQNQSDLKAKSKAQAIAEMLNCKNLDEVKTCWTKWKSFQADVDFSQLKEEMKISLTTIPN